MGPAMELGPPDYVRAVCGEGWGCLWVIGRLTYKLRAPSFSGQGLFPKIHKGAIKPLQPRGKSHWLAGAPKIKDPLTPLQSPLYLSSEERISKGLGCSDNRRVPCHQEARVSVTWVVFGGVWFEFCFCLLCCVTLGEPINFSVPLMPSQ